MKTEQFQHEKNIYLYIKKTGLVYRTLKHEIEMWKKNITHSDDTKIKKCKNWNVKTYCM